MADFEREVVVVNPNEKSLGTYSTSRAKIANNPIGAIAGGVVAWYITKKYTGVENAWAYAGIILVGIVGGAYATSWAKRNVNEIIF